VHSPRGEIVLLRNKLWVVAVAVAVCLSSVPAWASRTDDGPARAKDKKAASIRLATPKGVERPFPSQSLVDVSLAALARIDDKSSGSHASPGGPAPGLQKRSLVPRGHDGEGPSSGPAPGAGVAALPEPSALLSFAVGLLVARRAIGAMWR
jgi:hypothetical protein